MENQFLIVGQGIAGSLLAYDMYKAGLQFTIVSNPDDQRESDIVTRMYNPEVFDRLSKTWLVDEVLQVMTNMYKAIEKDLRQQFLYPMHVVKSLKEKESKVWDERIFDGDFSNYMGSEGKGWIKRGLENVNLFGSRDKSGYIDLSKMLSELKNFFHSKGNLIEARFSYKDIGFINEYITWRGVQAKTIVFCEGHYATQNPYFKNVPFVPVKGEMIEIECRQLPEKYIVDTNLFVMPMGKGHFKVGTTHQCRKPGEEQGFQTLLNLLERLDKLISKPYTVRSHWSGIRASICDGRPVLGVHPYNQHIAIFNGLGSKGVMLAPYFVREMVHSLLHRNYILSKEVDVRRFLN